MLWGTTYSHRTHRHALIRYYCYKYDSILHQREFFKTITPVNFNTVATPHIGLIRYPTFRSALFATLGPKLLSRTGEQFYIVDIKIEDIRRPMLWELLLRRWSEVAESDTSGGTQQG